MSNDDILRKGHIQGGEIVEKAIYPAVLTCITLCAIRPWVDAYSKGIFTLIGTGRMDFPVRGPVACPVRASREARR